MAPAAAEYMFICGHAQPKLIKTRQQKSGLARFLGELSQNLVRISANHPVPTYGSSRSKVGYGATLAVSRRLGHRQLRAEFRTFPPEREASTLSGAIGVSLESIHVPFITLFGVSYQT